MRRISSFAAIVVLVICQAVYSAEHKTERVLNGIGDSTPDRTVSPAGVDSLTILAIGSLSTVTVGTNNTFSTTDDTGRGVFSTWGVSISAPLNKDEDKTDIATLDGLVNSTSLRLNYAKFFAPTVNAISFLGDEERFNEIYDSVCRDVSNGSEAAGDGPIPPDGDCFEKSKILKYAKQRWQDVDSFFFDPDGIYHIVSFSASIGDRDFMFVDPAELDERNVSENPWALSASYGILPRKLGTLFVVGIEYQEGYKNAEEGTLCPLADPMTNIATCATGPIGEPLDDNKELVWIEARRRIGRTGVSVRVTHDNETDVTGIDVPIQFIRNKTGGLTGGLRLGWRDDTDDLILGVFVGSAFNLFN